MKTILLKSIHLRNFMGIREFILEADGQNLTVSARNGKGKTTLAKAIKWVLTGKDDEGNAPGSTKFPIKTCDSDNNPIHYLEHEAELVLLIDGQEMRLKKVYKEKWTRKRGTLTEEMTGHETAHYIDGTPLAEKEYLFRLARIADEETWRLLTDPYYFSTDRPGNTGFTWQKRRKLLFEMCGDMTDAEIIAATPGLAELPGILKGRDMEDYKKTLKSTQKETKDRLEKIPEQINGIDMVLPDLTGVIVANLPRDIANLRSQLQEKQQELARIQSGGQAAELRRKGQEIEAELLRLKSERQGDTQTKIENMRIRLNGISENGSEISSDIKGTENDIRLLDNSITSNEAEMQRLAGKWAEVDQLTFEYEQSDSCPTCGQALPQEQLQAAREKAEADFNLKKAQELEDIDKKGYALSEVTDKLKTEKAEKEKELAQLREQLNTARKEYTALQAEITALLQTPDPLQCVEYAAKLQEKAQVEAEIANLEAGNKDAIDKANVEIARIESLIQGLVSSQTKAEQREKGLQQIEALKQEQKKLAAEYERMERELFLLEGFIKAKCALVTDRINSHFRIARFRLFNQLVNGAIEPCCEVLCDGVGYNGGLNQGHQILTGVDIINQLQAHFGIIAPIIIDRAESLTEPVETEAQVIRLQAAEGVDELTVEVE